MGRAGFAIVVNWIIGALGSILIAIFGYGFYDYTQQAMIAGVPPSEFGLSGWTQSFVDRGKAAARRAQLEARRDGPLGSYFPESIAGWERVDWDVSYEDALRKRNGPTMDSDFAEIEAKVEAMPVVKAARVAEGAIQSLAARRAAVYLKGDRILVLKAKFKQDGKPTGMAGFIASQVQGQFGKDQVVRAHGGVAWSKRKSYDWQRELDSGSYHLSATIGQEIQLSGMTNAGLHEIDPILAAIRYADLRALVDVPEERATVKQAELSAQLQREAREEKRRAAEERRKFDRKLEGLARRYAGSGQKEVCLDFKGERHCAWVDN